MGSETALIEKAWKHLEDAVVYYQGRPVGTIATLDPGPTALNYDP